MKIVKWILIIAGGGFVLYIVGSIVALIVLFAQFDSSSYEELTANYEEKSKEIREVEQFVNSRLPSNKVIDIEFESDNSIGIFHVRVDENYESNWDVKIESQKTDSLLNKLGWDLKTLQTLKQKLDKANCISVQSGTPCQIGFQRHGMGMYFYNLFEEPIPDSLTNNYNDSCRYILYKEDVALEWLGGAIGVQCFPDFNRKRR